MPRDPIGRRQETERRLRSPREDETPKSGHPVPRSGDTRQGDRLRHVHGLLDGERRIDEVALPGLATLARHGEHCHQRFARGTTIFQVWQLFSTGSFGIESQKDG